MNLWLFHPDEKYLDPREVVCRLVKAMPTTLVDWQRGNVRVEEKRQELIVHNVPDMILASHQSLVDHTVYVQVLFPEFPDDYVYFILEPYVSFEVCCSEPNNESFLNYAAKQISSLLGYEVSIDET